MIGIAPPVRFGIRRGATGGDEYPEWPTPPFPLWTVGRWFARLDVARVLNPLGRPFLS